YRRHRGHVMTQPEANTRREQAYAMIDNERAYQESKWGTIDQHPLQIGSYITILDVLLAKLKKTWVESRYSDWSAVQELSQVAATAVAALEQHLPGDPKLQAALYRTPEQMAHAAADRAAVLKSLTENAI
ncbi:MAG: hypothetical protein ACRC7O_02030, partial [Fimbriiglobus sp.]